MKPKLRPPVKKRPRRKIRRRRLKKKETAIKKVQKLKPPVKKTPNPVFSAKKAAEIEERIENIPIDEYDYLAVDIMEYITFLKAKIKWLTESRKRAKKERQKFEQIVSGNNAEVSGAEILTETAECGIINY